MNAAGASVGGGGGVSVGGAVVGAGSGVSVGTGVFVAGGTVGVSVGTGVCVGVSVGSGVAVGVTVDVMVGTGVNVGSTSSATVGASGVGWTEPLWTMRTTAHPNELIMITIDSIRTTCFLVRIRRNLTTLTRIDQMSR